MDVAAIAATQVASTAALTQQAVAMQLVKNAAEAQMQMANILAQQATVINPPQGFSVYA